MIIFGGSLHKMPPAKVMFIGFSEMGSIILGYSAIKRIKDRYPGVKLYFWTFKGNSDVVDILEIIPPANIFTVRNENLCLMFADIVRNLRRIRKENIDVAIDFELFSRFSSILGYLSAAKIKVGFNRYKMEGLYRGDLHTHKVIYNSYLHISKNFIALAESAMLYSADPPLLRQSADGVECIVPKITVQEKEIDAIWTKLRQENPLINKNSKIIVIRFDFDDKVSVRAWPRSYYLSLIKKILAKDNVYVVLISVKPTDIPKTLDYQRCINLTGKTTVRDLVCLFNIANVLMGHDGGTLHIASLSNIYIIALFGPESPLLYAPLTEKTEIFYKRFYCSPCLSAYNNRNTTCNDNRCMQAITVDEVYTEMLKIIS